MAMTLPHTIAAPKGPDKETEGQTDQEPQAVPLPAHLSVSASSLEGVAREWREDRDRLQAIMDNCTACIYLKDLEGRYLYINRQFETLFHISRQSILGNTDFEVFTSVTADA